MATHLTPGYLQAEVDRLQFDLRIPDAVAADEIAEQKLAANAETDPFAAPMLRSAEDTPSASSVDPADLESIPPVPLAHPVGFEPLTYGSGGAVGRQPGRGQCGPSLPAPNGNSA